MNLHIMVNSPPSCWLSDESGELSIGCSVTVTVSVSVFPCRHMVTMKGVPSQAIRAPSVTSEMESKEM